MQHHQQSIVSRATLLAFLSLFCAQSLALTCYDNTGKDGKMRVVSSDDYAFCSLIPETPANGALAGKVYGLGAANDDLTPYLQGFANNDDKYEVLTMCIYERYNFTPFSSKFSAPELLFRCVCNYDKCNSRTNFDFYLDGLSRKPQAPSIH